MSLAAQGVTEASSTPTWRPLDQLPLRVRAVRSGGADRRDGSGGAARRSTRSARLFTRNPYLTRLATFISPEEMTKDPLFVTNRLPARRGAQPHRRRTHHVRRRGVLRLPAPMRIELEDGRQVGFLGGACGGTVDRSDIDAMPSAEVAWNRDPDSEGQVVIDNRPAITQTLAAHNAKIPTPDSGCGCSLRARPRRLAMLFAAVATRHHAGRSPAPSPAVARQHHAEAVTGSSASSSRNTTAGTPSSRRWPPGSAWRRSVRRSRSARTGRRPRCA